MKSAIRVLFFAILIGLLLIQITSAQSSAGGAPTDKNATVVTSTEKTAIVFPEVEGWVKGATTTYPTAELGL